MKKEEFQKKLTDMGAFAKEKGNRLSMEEVRSFFQDMELSEEQYSLVYAYLASCQVTVEGYVPPRKAEQKEELPLTPEEQHFQDTYQAELKALNIIEGEELSELIRKVEDTGDGKAKALLTEQFLPKVLELAHEFRGHGLLLGDLVQEGNIGLMLAMETLGMRPEELGAEEYLLEEIRRTIGQAVEEDQAEKQSGSQLAERLNHLSDEIKKLTEELEREVSIEELSAYMDMPVEEIEDLLKLAGEGSEDEGTETGK